MGFIPLPLMGLTGLDGFIGLTMLDGFIGLTGLVGLLGFIMLLTGLPPPIGLIPWDQLFGTPPYHGVPPPIGLPHTA